MMTTPKRTTKTPEPFEAGVKRPELIFKIKGFTRPRPSKTPVFEIRIDGVKGYHLAEARIYSRKHVRNCHAYECLDPDCMYEFRLKWPKDMQNGVMVDCPACGSLYTEWLSFEVDPAAVFLGLEEEWDQIPDGGLRWRVRYDYPRDAPSATGTERAVGADQRLPVPSRNV